MITEIEIDKLIFIESVNDTISALVEPIIKEAMKEYSEKFGGFSWLDANLWCTCKISNIVATQAALKIDDETIPY